MTARVRTPTTSTGRSVFIQKRGRLGLDMFVTAGSLRWWFLPALEAPPYAGRAVPPGLRAFRGPNLRPDLFEAGPVSFLVRRHHADDVPLHQVLSAARRHCLGEVTKLRTCELAQSQLTGTWEPFLEIAGVMGVTTFSLVGPVNGKRWAATRRQMGAIAFTSSGDFGGGQGSGRQGACPL